MHRGDDVAGMAVNAQGGRSNSGGMRVAVGSKVLGVALRAGCSTENGGDLRPVCGIFQCWWRGVAMRALVGVHLKWTVCRMTDGNAGRVVKDDTCSGG